MIKINLALWHRTKDGDPLAMEIFKRHYTYRENRKQRQFVGPGYKLVLISPNADALFVWRKFKSKAEHSDGINCAVFRNEGSQLSSELIKAAMDIAWQQWPGTRLYTYVNLSKIRSSNPGYCFQMAGWSLVRDDEGKPKLTSYRRYNILEFNTNGSENHRSIVL